MSRGRNLQCANTYLMWDRSEPPPPLKKKKKKKASSLTDSRGPCCSRRRQETDTVSQRWWRTWQLMLGPHVTLGPFNVIVWCVPVAGQHNSPALVNGSPGRQLQMSSLYMYDPWHRNVTRSISQLHIDRGGCRLFNFAALPRRLSLCRDSLVSTRLKCFPFPSDDVSSLPLTFPAYFSASPRLADCRRQWTVKGCFFFKVEEKLCVSQLVRRRALARPHGGRGRSRCWRVAVARLSGALVPLGRTFVVGRK